MGQFRSFRRLDRGASAPVRSVQTWRRGSRVVLFVASVGVLLGSMLATPQGVGAVTEAAPTRVKAVWFSSFASPVESFVESAVTDGTYGYFGTDQGKLSAAGEPARVVRVRLSDMTRIDALAMNAGEKGLTAAVTDGTYGYFAVFSTNPARIVKVRFSDMTRVASIDLDANEKEPTAAVTDGTFGYFMVRTSSSSTTQRLVKIRLADMTRVGAVDIVDVNFMEEGFITGGYAYFAGDVTGKVVKIQLSDMTVVGTPLQTSFDRLRGATTDGTFGYFGVYAASTTRSGTVIKVNLADMTQTATAVVAPESDGAGGTIGNATNDGTYAYFTDGYNKGGVIGGIVVKVRMSDLAVMGTLVMPNEDAQSTFFNDGTFGYIGLHSAPGKVVKILLNTSSVPAAPTGVNATPGNGQVGMSWTAPSDGGSALTGSTVTASPGGATCTATGTATSCVVTGLTNGTEYTLTVASSNASGQGPASNPVTATPSADAVVPGVPDAPTITGVEVGDGFATVTVAPAGTGGTPTQYTVTAEPGGASCTIVVPATSCTITGLTNGRAYTFAATASNSDGSSPLSAPSDAVAVVPPKFAG